MAERWPAEERWPAALPLVLPPVLYETIRGEVGTEELGSKVGSEELGGEVGSNVGSEEVGSNVGSEQLGSTTWWKVRRAKVKWGRVREEF